MGRVSACIAFCLSSTLLVLTAANAESAEDARARTAPSEEDLQAVRSLLDSLAEALAASNAEAIEAMLSPSLTAMERNRILSRARAGFQRTAYCEFTFPAVLESQLKMTGADEAELNAPARFEFTAQSGGAAAHGELPCAFRFVREEKGWSIGRTDLFEQLATIRSEAPLSKADKESIRSLLKALGTAMTSGDVSAIGELLSPKLTPTERRRIISRSRGEFEKTAYPEFEFDLSGELSAEALADDEIRLVVSASYEYESRIEGGMADNGEMSYQFRLAKTNSQWGIAGSELFEQFSAVRFEQVLGWLFLGGFLGVLIAFFWAWMSLDAWMRTKRLRYGLLLFLSTPAGAALYFFAVYLRRKFMSREE